MPGTSEAQLAVLKAQIPQQATLKRAEAKLTVTYAGQPQFKPIPGTDLIYAVNTSFQVIGSGGKYYVCYQGAWFVGPTPNGPWALADSIPPAIHTIPPSSPVYNVSYVNVYAATPETVTYGYTAGYAMGFLTAGALVYGTGYYYPPYVVPGVMPVYYPYPYSYAGAVWYNPDDRDMGAGRHSLRAIRWGSDRRRGIQPGHWRLGARRRRLWPIRRRRRVVLLQSEHGHIRARRCGVGA